MRNSKSTESSFLIPWTLKPFLYEAKLVGLPEETDVAVLSTREVDFLRLPICGSELPMFRSVYTDQRTEPVIATIHQDQIYPGTVAWESRCSASSVAGCSGGPVLDQTGHVVGMLRSHKGGNDRVFPTSAGLMVALLEINICFDQQDWG